MCPYRVPRPRHPDSEPRRRGLKVAKRRLVGWSQYSKPATAQRDAADSGPSCASRARRDSCHYQPQRSYVSSSLCARACKRDMVVGQPQLDGRSEARPALFQAHLVSWQASIGRTRLNRHVLGPKASQPFCSQQQPRELRGKGTAGSTE